MRHPHQPVQLSDDELDSETTDKPLDFDKMLRFEIGEFGRYQILVAFTTGLFAAIVSFVTLNFMFSATVPEHRYDRKWNFQHFWQNDDNICFSFIGGGVGGNTKHM